MGHAAPGSVDGSYLGLCGLRKHYGDGPAVVAGVDLDVARGEFLTLLGPSGCGKTTILRIIAGLVPPSAGRIRLGGVDITDAPAHRRNLGLVFQNYALFPHLSISRNVAFGLEMRGLGQAAIRERVSASLELVRLGELRHRMPKQLSGGQQQRVALARALVIEPALLLLDEPLSNLDAKLREELRDEIREIQRRLGITAVFVTHDQGEALTMSDRIGVMNAGRIEQLGSPAAIYDAPETPFVATFIGRMNRVLARVEASDANWSRLAANGFAFSAPGRLPVGTRVTAMIRPHRIRLHPDAPADTEPANRISTRISKVVFAGDVIHYEITVGDATLAVEHSTGSAPGLRFAPGQEVVATWAKSDTLVFAEP